jgi:polyisoprenoid-binding protein YceI
VPDDFQRRRRRGGGRRCLRKEQYGKKWYTEQMRTIAFAAILALLGSSLAAPVCAQETIWIVDTAHSTAQFSTSHLFMSRVTGTIPIKAAEISIPSGSAVPSSVRATLDPSGVNTQNSDRDAVLRSAHFLDVAQYPEIRFESTGITRSDASHFAISGNLTIHGVTHPVTLSASYVGEQGSGASLRLTYEAHTTIDRTQFGMTYGQPAVGTSLAIVLKIQAVRQ